MTTQTTSDADGTALARRIMEWWLGDAQYAMEEPGFVEDARVIVDRSERQTAAVDPSTESTEATSRRTGTVTIHPRKDTPAEPYPEPPVPDWIELRPREDGSFDEIVAHFANGMVHIETMDDRNLYLGFYEGPAGTRTTSGLQFRVGSNAPLEYSYYAI